MTNSKPLNDGPYEVHIARVSDDGEEWQFVGWASALEIKYDVEYDDLISSHWDKLFPTSQTYTITANLTNAVDGYFGRVITQKPGQRRYRRHLG